MGMTYRNETIILLFGDEEVLLFNFSRGLYEIINNRYMPFGIRDVVVDSRSDLAKELNVRENSPTYTSWLNERTIMKWLKRRTLLLSRKNAKKIYDLLDFDQIEDDYTKTDMAITCRAASVLDKYWIKINGEQLCWNEVDISRNRLNDIVAQVALHGDSLSFQGSYITPEVTTNGVFAKAWRRHADGTLWLYKLSSEGNNQSQKEVMVSNLLDKCNVSHVRYEAGEDDGEYVCMCQRMSNDRYSVIPANEYNIYCAEHNIDFLDEILRIDSDGYYKMHIVDYLISNSDRHSYNWGFYMDNNTMELVSLHPLFDHNGAFDEKMMNNDNSLYKCTRTPINLAARYAMGEVDFYFTDEIKRSDFMTDDQYRSFIRRAEELGIKTIKDKPKSVFDAAKIMGE